MAQIDLPGGITKAVTKKAATGRFTEGNNVRFIAGKPQKIGGNARWSTSAMAGMGRGMHSYLSTGGLEYLGVGTETHLYSFDSSGALADITPYREVATLGANPVSVVLGDNTVTVTDNAHGAEVGARVTLGAATVGGLAVGGTWTVTEVVDSNTWRFEHTSPGGSTATGGTGITASYFVNPGSTSGASAFGYGIGPYGEGTYGTPRDIADAVAVQPRVWSLDNYGGFLIGSPGGGNNTVYLFDPATDTRAASLANAPGDVRYIFVTEERYPMALRADMYVSWPDQGDPTDWTPTLINTANTRRLSAGSELRCGGSLSEGISLVWTNLALYLFQYTGSLAIYESRLAGTNCGIVGPEAFCFADGMAFWMGPKSFFMYNGFVQSIPRMDDVKSYVFDNLDEANAYKIHGFYNPRFREVQFNYPDKRDAITEEPSRYVAFSIDTWDWYTGELDRVGSTERRATTGVPLMTATDGHVYEHELSEDFNNNGASLPWYIESGWFAPGEEDAEVDIFAFAPDFEKIVGTVTLTIFSRDRSRDAANLDSEVHALTPSSTKADVRVTGRLVAFRLEQDEVDGNFRGGVPYVEYQVAGERP